ncbi:MAG: S41 family peptidase [Lentimicrobium sp.]|jgi:carboxyl-terminal processing protease|nr:S41 family peptidase [Lentimicrobium sp.]
MKKITSFLLFVAFSLTFNVAVRAQVNSSDFEISKNLDIFATMYKELNNSYVDELNHGELITYGIEAILDRLDPYTVFIPEADIEDYAFMTTGQYGGIGALIHQQGGYVVVSEPYENSPAMKAGLIQGDRILKVNDKDAKGKSVSDVSMVLKGQPGTKVKLLIKREGLTAPIEKEVTRENVAIPNVTHSLMLNDKTGYIKLSGFTQTSSKEFKEAFLALREKGKLSSLIIDLRDNGGGLMNEAVNIANFFVRKGELIVSTRGKSPDRNKSYKTIMQPIDTEIPLVVLVNGYSASASEIVAGALQDLDRAVIIGERTFGKGLVQNILPLSYKTQMKVTVAKYYIPSGRCIQAIDYGHRDSLGFSVKIPDSLVHEFKTKTGRLVYDGGGIEPDIATEDPQVSNIAISLISRYLIFDYANQFKREHDTILPARQFTITDQMYDDFVKWLEDKDYDYVTRSERLLAQLKQTTENEKYYEELKDDLADLETKMKHNKDSDLIKFKQEISYMLRSEIVARYYAQKGRVEAMVTEDPEVKIAIELLDNSGEYSGILTDTSAKPKS